VDTFEEEAVIDIKATQDTIDQLKSKLVEVEGQMEKYLKELNLI
jgi:type I restriction enzyme M protein